MGYGMSLVHVYGHQNNGRPALTLTLLASINVRLDALAEHIMSEFILLPATGNTIAIGLLDPQRIPSVSINGAPVQFHISKSIAYKRSQRRLLEHWDDRNLTHMSDWDKIDLTSFKHARETTTNHNITT